MSLANWFETQYLVDPHNRFSYSASGIPGVQTNQNADESFNRILKSGTVCRWQGGRQSLTVYCRETIQEKLTNLTKSLGQLPITIIASYPISRFVLQKAQSIIYSQLSRYLIYLYEKYLFKIV